MSMRRALTLSRAAGSRTRLILAAGRSNAGCKGTPSSVCGLRLFLRRTADRAATSSTFRASSQVGALMPGGYMFVHRVWIFSRQHQRKGWGSVLVEACLDDAGKADMSGAAQWSGTVHSWLTAACSWQMASKPLIPRRRITSSIDAPLTRPSRRVGIKNSRSTAGASPSSAPASAPTSRNSPLTSLKRRRKTTTSRPRWLSSGRRAMPGMRRPPYAIFALIYNGRVAGRSPDQPHPLPQHINKCET
jgi:hypothetical protein